jgi:hypothetical protein
MNMIDTSIVQSLSAPSAQLAGKNARAGKNLPRFVHHSSLITHLFSVHQ